jgi:hypothetical protein
MENLALPAAKVVNDGVVNDGASPNELTASHILLTPMLPMLTEVAGESKAGWSGRRRLGHLGDGHPRVSRQESAAGNQTSEGNLNEIIHVLYALQIALSGVAAIGVPHT